MIHKSTITVSTDTHPQLYSKESVGLCFHRAKLSEWLSNKHTLAKVITVNGGAKGSYEVNYIYTDE